MSGASERRAGATVRRARARLAAPGAVAAAALVALASACADVGTAPGVPAAVSYTRLPAPSIVVGDTLRDTLGVPADLRRAVLVYDADGRRIEDYPVQFLVPQAAANLSFDSTTGFLTSTGATTLTQALVQARAGRLVPPALTLALVPAPTVLVRQDTLADSLDFLAFSAGTSTPLDAVLLAVTGTDTVRVPRHYVEYRVVSQPASVENLRFVPSTASDTAASSPFDTTSDQGVATRLLRGRRVAGAGVGRDTVIVEARFRRGRDVAGTVQFPVTLIRR